jgi:hypothetical protein
MKEMSKNFNIWLLAFLLQAIAITTAGYFGLFKTLLVYDFTFIGIITLTIWFFLSLSIGYQTYGGHEPVEWQIFLTEKFMGLGLLGTVIGLSYAFAAFGDLKIEDPESVKLAIKHVTAGMSTAFLTTICSLITSYTAKFQIVMSRHNFSGKKVQLNG